MFVQEGQRSLLLVDPDELLRSLQRASVSMRCDECICSDVWLAKDGFAVAHRATRARTLSTFSGLECGMGGMMGGLLARVV